MGSSAERGIVGATDAGDGAKSVEETKAAAGTLSEIREYSEESFQEENDGAANDNKDHHGAETKASTAVSTPESIEESQDDHEPRTAIDEEHERDIAQQKLNRRARAQPGDKRGGRRDTGRGGWRRWGKKKDKFEAGDLVEAEWKESGWWYGGYIGESSTNAGGSRDDTTVDSGSAREPKAGKKQKGVFHVVFADGDEADVRGKNLKPLRTKGASGHVDPTALPVHIPVVDVGCGRLHCDSEPPSSHKNQATGGRSGVDLASEGNGDWWETGTRYAFQPRLAGDISTVLSFVNKGGRYGDRIGGDQRRGYSPQDSGGGGADDGVRAGPTTNRVASGLSIQRQGRDKSSPKAPAEDGGGRELMRIVKAPEGNENHGRRVFFVV